MYPLISLRIKTLQIELKLPRVPSKLHSFNPPSRALSLIWFYHFCVFMMHIFMFFSICLYL